MESLQTSVNAFEAKLAVSETQADSWRRKCDSLQEEHTETEDKLGMWM